MDPYNSWTGDLKLLSLSQLPAAVLPSALIGNYFSGLMPLFRLSPCGKEWRIMNLMGGKRCKMRPWHRQNWSFLCRQRRRTAHLWSTGVFAGQRGDSCTFFSPTFEFEFYLMMQLCADLAGQWGNLFRAKRRAFLPVCPHRDLSN